MQNYKNEEKINYLSNKLKKSLKGKNSDQEISYVENKKSNNFATEIFSSDEESEKKNVYKRKILNNKKNYKKEEEFTSKIQGKI